MTPGDVEIRVVAGWSLRVIPRDAGVQIAAWVGFFDAFIYNPLHGARRAMAVAKPLPLTEQRRAFLISLFLSGPARAVKVGYPCSPSSQLPQKKEKKRPLAP